MSAGRSSGRGGAARPGSVRIIGGEWRGRRLPIVPDAGIRPTPDRVRETLFNWLAPWLSGRRCLDLYAGTGVLGLEALSRGAADCCFVERDPVVAAALEAALRRFGGSGRVVPAEAMSWLAGPATARYQLVFVDPPYASRDLGGLCTLLAGGWLADDAFIYLEMPRRRELPGLPAGWSVWRDSTAGDIRFCLARVTQSN